MKKEKQRGFKVMFSSRDAGSSDCSGSSCPTVYETTDGTFIFQGYCVKDVAINTPKNETIIELPKEFVEAFILQFAK